MIRRVFLLLITTTLTLIVSLSRECNSQCISGRCYPIGPSYPVPDTVPGYSYSVDKSYSYAKRFNDVIEYVCDLDTSDWARKEDEFVSKTFNGPDGRYVRCNMPMTKYIRNTGGSDGAGLCVFTSIYHTSVYNGYLLDGYRKYMERRPGGGYPEKVDRTLKSYCSEHDVYIPNYVHVYKMSSLDVVKLAIERGHMVCITWGCDYTHYRGQIIAHMVNCVYLDDDWGCILDNNFIEEFLWVKRPTFDQYAAVSPGSRDALWAIIFFDNPMPIVGGR